jgi:hypothetical protein
MRPMLRLVVRVAGTSRRTLVLAMALAPLATLVAAPPALASLKKLKEEFLPFAHCPLEAAKICMVSTTTGGEFVIDRKTVPIEVPVTLQGGLATVLDTETLYESTPLIGASGASSLSKTPLTVPGGLVGIGGLGGEVTATAELAGAPSSVIINRWNLLAGKTPAVTLPLKVKLSNEVLGEECYIGSEAEPIVLHLTTGTTSPPSPGEPIKGSIGAGVGGRAKGKITYIEKATLVDNDFAVPGASGCGGALSPVIDETVDLDVGIPAPAGYNTAIMDGSLEETSEEFVAEYLPKEKKKKTK